MKLAEHGDSEFDGWLRQQRPLSNIPLVKEIFADYLDYCKPYSERAGEIRRESAPPPDISEKSQSGPNTAAALQGTLLIGWRTGALASDAPVILPVQALSRHVVIRAGSGSGKTVLLKRLIEEAALSGVSSIVIDGANDLVFLDDRVPSTHPGWFPGDVERAARYQSEVDVCVWTPGLRAGRPLRFSALPDFSSLAGTDPNAADELDQAVSMAVGSLSEVAGLESGMAAKLKQAVLKEALLYFARKGGRALKDLAEILDNLPAEADAGIKDAPKLASQIADRIRASIVTDRLLAGDATGRDPDDLLCTQAGRPRVSVVSLEGLTEQERPRLVDQLAISLFAWVRKHPQTGPTLMNGLFVLDEAQEFLPSTRSTACKQSLMRLAVQARKYGLGLMMATQNPKSLDYNAVSQFSTHFYGKAAAPQAIEVIRKAIEERGGQAPDLANLEKGTFYFTSTEGCPIPIRIKSPMCLTHHPDQRTATQQEIISRALRART